MALQNPYAAALKVDPNREKEILTQLRSNPEEMAKLGLGTNENFTNLKNDPVKYNRVLSYVKNKAYKNPAYSALSEGSSSPEFVQEQTKDYADTPTQYQIKQAPKLEEQYGVQPLQQRYQTQQELSYSAPMTIAEEVKKKGGYDIDALKTANDTAVTNFLDVRDKYMRGQVDRASYINALSQMSVASRSLEKGETGLKTETEKAMGIFKENLARAKDQYDNAYKRYTDSLELETKGYSEARTEKRKAAEDMYAAAKEFVDDARKEEKEYQSAKGRIYNPYTGKYEAKSTGPATLTKMYAEADSMRKELQEGKADWGQAYNRIAAQYPEANKPIPGDPSGKTYIDAALGGQAVMEGGVYNPEKSAGYAKAGYGATTAGEYFSRPDASGQTKYYYGSKDKPQASQEITPDQYLKGTSKSESIVEGSKLLTDVLDLYKQEGYTKKDLEAIIKKKYDIIPDVAQQWLDENFDFWGNAK